MRTPIPLALALAVVCGLGLTMCSRSGDESSTTHAVTTLCDIKRATCCRCTGSTCATPGATALVSDTSCQAYNARPTAAQVENDPSRWGQVRLDGAWVASTCSTGALVDACGQPCSCPSAGTGTGTGTGTTGTGTGSGTASAPMLTCCRCNSCEPAGISLPGVESCAEYNTDPQKGLPGFWVACDQCPSSCPRTADSRITDARTDARADARVDAKTDASTKGCCEVTCGGKTTCRQTTPEQCTSCSSSVLTNVCATDFPTAGASCGGVTFKPESTCTPPVQPGQPGCCDCPCYLKVKCGRLPVIGSIAYHCWLEFQESCRDAAGSPPTSAANQPPGSTSDPTGACPVEGGNGAPRPSSQPAPQGCGAKQIEPKKPCKCRRVEVWQSKDSGKCADDGTNKGHVRFDMFPCNCWSEKGGVVWEWEYKGPDKCAKAECIRKVATEMKCNQNWYWYLGNGAGNCNSFARTALERCGISKDLPGRAVGQDHDPKPIDVDINDNDYSVSCCALWNTVNVEVGGQCSLSLFGLQIFKIDFGGGDAACQGPLGLGFGE